MKILGPAQIREVDTRTIQQEPVSSIDLMERAARACHRRLLKLLEPQQNVLVFCGKGNNGGDGLAITRLLCDSGFSCKAVLVHYTEHFSNDAAENYRRLKDKYPASLLELHSENDLGAFTYDANALAIDALLGTGINKAVDGLLGDVIQFVNDRFVKVVSVDVPSGLFVDKSSRGNTKIIRSTLTLSFQLPKLAFLLPENAQFVQEFELLDIQLSTAALLAQSTNNYYVTKDLVASLLKPRPKFSHKGQFGRVLLLAGSKGKSGAALISARAALRSGAGLLSACSTPDTLAGLLTHAPEAMGIASGNAEHIDGIDKPENYDAIAFGPGTGLHPDTQQTLKKILSYCSGKLVIDADGLNILSEHKTWLSFLPPNTILTPHPGEFERLCGKHHDDFERLEALRHFSVKHNCLVILKGAHSAIAMPDGNVFFNSSGNAGLAKGGSGDGLTGILLGLLSRGYSAPQAAILGTFVHGYAADLCIKKKSMESLLISDVIERLPQAFRKLEKKL